MCVCLIYINIDFIYIKAFTEYTVLKHLYVYTAYVNMSIYRHIYSIKSNCTKYKKEKNIHIPDPKGLITLVKVAFKSAIMRLCNMLNRKILRTEIMVLHISALQIILYSHHFQGFLITLTFGLNTVKSKAPGPPPFIGRVFCHWRADPCSPVTLL